LAKALRNAAILLAFIKSAHDELDCWSSWSPTLFGATKVGNGLGGQHRRGNRQGNDHQRESGTRHKRPRRLGRIGKAFASGRVIDQCAEQYVTAAQADVANIRSSSSCSGLRRRAARLRQRSLASTAAAVPVRSFLQLSANPQVVMIYLRREELATTGE